MKLSNAFKMRQICGENILTPESVGHVDFNKIISMNSTAVFLWNALKEKDFTVQDMKELLLSEYEVDESTAARDAQSLADQWAEAGLLE